MLKVLNVNILDSLWKILVNFCVRLKYLELNVQDIVNNMQQQMFISILLGKLSFILNFISHYTQNTH